MTHVNTQDSFSIIGAQRKVKTNIGIIAVYRLIRFVSCPCMYEIDLIEDKEMRRFGSKVRETPNKKLLLTLLYVIPRKAQSMHAIIATKDNHIVGAIIGLRVGENQMIHEIPEALNGRGLSWSAAYRSE